MAKIIRFALEINKVLDNSEWGFTEDTTEEEAISKLLENPAELLNGASFDLEYTTETGSRNFFRSED